MIVQQIGKGLTRIRILSATRRERLKKIEGVEVKDERVIFPHNKLHKVLRAL